MGEKQPGINSDAGRRFAQRHVRARGRHISRGRVVILHHDNLSCDNA